jgi:predicted NAD/FAD-binding protein
MNKIQGIPESVFGPVLITVNPIFPPHVNHMQVVWDYTQPVYGPETIQSEKQLPGVQNVGGISYCGAWTNSSFDEDGVTTGLEIATQHLGVELPFTLAYPSREPIPALGPLDEIMRDVVEFILAKLVYFQILCRILQRLGIMRQKMKQD